MTMVAAKLQTRIAEIQASVASFYGVSVDDIVHGSRSVSHVVPRRVAIALAYQAGASKQLLALAFHRDHATVIYSIEKARGCVPPELRHLGRPMVQEAPDAPAAVDEAEMALQSGVAAWGGVVAVAPPPVREEPAVELRLAQIERKLDRLLSVLDQLGLRGVA